MYKSIKSADEIGQLKKFYGPNIITMILLRNAL